MLAASLLGLGCGDGGDRKTDASKPANAQRESFVFVQDARSATVDTRKGTMTLRGASPSVQYFSDRPERIAGVTSVDAFRKSWSRVFGDDPPNAAIQHVAGRAGARAQVAELLGPPRYRGGRTLTYRVKLVDPPKDVRRRVSLAGVSLFIDAGSEDGADLAPQRVGHCSPIDPRCATGTAAAPCPSVYDPPPCGGSAKAEAAARCNPEWGECAGRGAGVGCYPGGADCATPEARPGCTITDPRCPTAVKAGCSPWDPRCATRDARSRCGNPYECRSSSGSPRCVYSPTHPCTDPSLEDRPGCSPLDPRDCRARGPAKKK